MKSAKKSLAVLLAVALLAGIFPLGAMATEENDQSAVPEITEIGARIGEDYVVATPVEQKSDDDAELMSLLPLETIYYDLDLTGYLEEELKNASLQTLIGGLTSDYESGAPENDAAKYAVWAKWYYYDEDGNWVSENDDYQRLGETVDLSSGLSCDYTIELIVGACDQLNPDNVRYRVNVRTGSINEMLHFHATTTDGEPITIYQDYNVLAHYLEGSEHYFWEVGAKASEYSEGNQIKLSLSFGNAAWEARNFDVAVYEGYYHEADQLPAADSEKNITAQIWRDGETTVEGYQAEYSWSDLPEFTLVLTGEGSDKHVLPFGVEVRSVGMSVSYNSLCKKETTGDYTDVSWWGDGNTTETTENNIDVYRITLSGGNSLVDTYYVRLSFYDPERDGFNQISSVHAAYVGQLTQSQVDAKTPGGEEDVKDYLFYSNDHYSSDGYANGYLDGGYAVDFSQHRSGIVFTVLDREGDIHYVDLRLVGVAPIVPITDWEQDPLSEDIYFRVTDAEAGDGYIRSYTMPYHDDSYYHNGYQTVFLLNDENGPIAAKKITPVFYTGDGVKMFSNGNPGDTGTAGSAQTSGETAINFLSGNGLRYTASAENKENLKNYWVTFVTQQDKPTLFVNGTNDEANYQEDSANPGNENKIPARVIYLTKPYDYHHDIFFANLGATALDGLSVILTGPDGTGEAVGVELDSYWTIGSTKTLAGFTTTDSPDNIGKIRLQPKQDATTGEMIASRVDGLLTIGAGSGADRQEVKIRLAGVAGEFKITTEKLWDGIKNVSYSSLLQTNYMTGGDASIRFSLTSGRLPTGLSLQKNGEIYGIPTAVGTYTFTITATCEETILGQANTWTDSKTYTVEITNSSDSAAVWNYEASIFGDEAYKILIAIPNEDNEDNIGAGATKGENSWENETMILHSDGDYSTFVDKVFLDGRQLTSGVDYTSEEGSTRLVIRTQTLTNTTRGTHTLSVESRVGDKETGTLHRAAQNYNLTTLGRNPSSGGGSGSSVRSYSLTVAPTTYGTVKSSLDKVSAGAKVTLTVTPDEGYLLDTIKATDASGAVIALTEGEDGIYTFTMPSGAVTVTATFKPHEQMPDEIDSRHFLDVSAESWYAPAVDYVAQVGLMTGVSERIFQPEAQTSRAMLATILYRMEGSPTQEDVAFADVQAGMWYTAAMAWAKEVGVLAGYDDGNLGPDDTLTREQVAVIFYHYAQMKDYDISARGNLSQYLDVNEVSDFAAEALSWANGIGLIVGGGDDRLIPKSPASRAQIAQILMNFPVVATPSNSEN